MTNANLIDRDLRLLDMVDGDLEDAERGLEASALNPTLTAREAVLVGAALENIKWVRVSLRQRRDAPQS